MKAFFRKIFGKEIKHSEPKVRNALETQKEFQMKEEPTLQQETPPTSVDDFDCDPNTFHDLLQKRPHIKLIDVRTKEEYKSGHISGAALLPVQELSQERIDALGVTKQDEILLYCRSGGRSGHALHELQSLGYKNTKHLAGGILAWEEKKLPLKK